MAYPAVFIVVLNWNGYPDTTECLRSLFGLTYPNYRVVVVDNGSTDDSADLLAREHPDVTVIRSKWNRGYAGGNNLGIVHALERGAKYVWLLNNDTVVDPEALSYLVADAEEDRRVGIIGSKIYYHSDPARLWYAGGTIVWWKGGTMHVGMDKIDHGQFDQTRTTDYVTGCSLFVRGDLIRQIGLMDEAFFLYYEETDWNVTAVEAGWKILFEPRSVVWHKVSRSVGSFSPVWAYYDARNALRFVRKHQPALLPIALVYSLPARTWRFGRNGRWKHLWMAIRGILDFLRSRWGPAQAA